MKMLSFFFFPFLFFLLKMFFSKTRNLLGAEMKSSDDNFRTRPAGDTRQRKLCLEFDLIGREIIRTTSANYEAMRAQPAQKFDCEIGKILRLPIGLPERKRILKCLTDIRFRASFLTLQLHKYKFNQVQFPVNLKICREFLFLLGEY